MQKLNFSLHTPWHIIRTACQCKTKTFFQKFSESGMGLVKATTTFILNCIVILKAGASFSGCPRAAKDVYSTIYSVNLPPGVFGLLLSACQANEFTSRTKQKKNKYREKEKRTRKGKLTLCTSYSVTGLPCFLTCLLFDPLL